ncbi:MAG: hypothetical protein DHS20C17_21960 [Cyclobacteriaceae bacterium]|nr:MAG: hypothetical protein DHS20C17_21960 [Cyclobacteriaceae bacterium]
MLLFYSCGASGSEEYSDTQLSPEQAEVKQLELQVLQIHDEVMPEMGTLVTLKDKVEAKNSQLEESGDSQAHDQVIVNSMVISNLDEAHEAMMQWMRDFHKVDIEEDPAKNLQYLEQEKQEILYVQDQVHKAITAAEETLGTRK